MVPEENGGGRELSELEGSTLGVVRRLQPCTAYGVRKVFRDSPTAHWKASAGAVYPLIERLVQRELLAAEDHLQGKRRSRRLRLTRRGLVALRRWLGPPLSTAALSIPDDPLRTRLRFLGILSRSERRRFLEEAVDASARQVAEVTDLLEQARSSEDRYWPIAIRAALSVARARHAWLEDIASEIDAERPD